MAASYVGAGTYADGNNASVSPGLPAGLQEGDLLVLLAAIKEDAGSVNTPSGWTLALSGVLTGQTEVSTAVCYRYYTAGVTAPTVTFSGGGANDSTQAIILAFRGTATSSPIQRLTLNSGSFPTIGVNVTTDGTKTDTGDQIVIWRVATNDDTPNDNGLIGPTSGTPVTVTRINNLTTLGSDAALNISTGTSTNATPTAYILIPPHRSGGANGLFDGFAIAKGGTTYSATGAGGAKLGGAASASYRASVFPYAGTGGAKAGGSAAASYRSPTFVYTPDGGALVGGDAAASYRQTVMPYAGSGGALVGGEAVAALIAPTSYHIDFVNGSDSNTGLSWASALKTFQPFVDGAVTLAPGDRVKIAKTGGESSHGTFSNRQLSSMPKTSYGHGWSSGSGYSFSDGFLENNMVLLDAISGTTGWTWPSFTYVTPNSYTMQPYANSALRFAIHGTPFLQGRMVGYKPLSATRNLSGYGRLEVRFSVYKDGWGDVPMQAGLMLCSDAAGAVPLLSIPLEMSKTYAGVFAYEGALPDGVNSIALYTDVQNSGQGTYLIYSLIACQPLSSPNYVGHFTQYRFGNHEASVWHLTNGFTEISGFPYAMLSANITGPAALHNTTMTVYSRNAVGWNRLDRYNTGYITYPAIGSYDVRTILLNATGFRPTFALPDLQSISSTPITITGGYDTGTDTVTGKTALIHRQFDTQPDYNFLIPPFLLADTEYVTFKNIDVATLGCSLLGIEGDSVGMRWENCELVDMPSATSTNGISSSVQHKTVVGAAQRPTLTDAYFKDCKGLLYLYTHNSSISGDYYDMNPVYQYAGHTLDNCILTPWAGVPLGATSSVGFNTPATMVGDLKIYCPGNYTRGDNAFSDNFNIQLPAIASGAAGTLRVWGGGACWVVPAPTTDGAFDGVYYFPDMVLENTLPMFTTARQLRNGQGSYEFGGDVEYMEVDSITINTTGSDWNTRQESGVADSSYWVSHLVGIGKDTPPLHIRNLTHAGLRWTGYSSTTGRRIAVAFSEGGPLQISNVDLTGADSSFDYYLVEPETPTTYDGAINGEWLTILDGVSRNPSAYGVHSRMIDSGTGAGYAQGVYDFRNVILGNTSPSFNVYAAAAYDAGSRVRFLECDISNPSADAYEPPNTVNLVATRVPGVGGFETGTIHEDCTIAATSYTTGMATQTTTEFVSEGVGIVDIRSPLAVIKSSPSEAHGVFFYNSFSVEKDFTIFPAGTFSWRTRPLRRLTSPLSLNIPLATVPLKVGKTATITLQTRRGHANAYCGLVVFPHGCNGFADPTDFEELIELNTAAINTWQTVTIQFLVQRSGIIDIYWSHFGLEGQYAWFTDLRVNET